MKPLSATDCTKSVGGMNKLFQTRNSLRMLKFVGGFGGSIPENFCNFESDWIFYILGDTC